MKKLASAEPTESSKTWLWPQTVAPNFAILACISVVFFAPVFLHPNKMFWANDIARLGSEYKEIQWQSFWKWGAFPLWDPTMFCGKSIVGDPLPALMFPLAFVFWLTSAPALFGYLFWVQVTLGAWGMFLFARKKGCDAAGALFAAVAFALNGKVGSHVFAGHVELVCTVMGLPWILWGVEHVLQRPNRRSAVLLGAVAAVVATSGSVQMLYWHLLFLGGYVAIWWAGEITDRGWRPPMRTVGWLAAAGGLFALASACWWFPIVRQALLLGARARGANFEFSTINSASLADLLRFLWPQVNVPSPQVLASDSANAFFWETSSYPSVIALGLAIAAFVTLKKVPGVLQMTALALLSVILALGESSPYFWLAYKFIPGFSLFRCPGRMFFYTNFAVAVLAGLMISHGPTARAKWAVAAIFGVAFEGLLLGALVLSRRTDLPIRGLWIPAVVAILGVCAGFLWSSGTFKEAPWRVLVLVILLCEFYVVWRPLINVVDERSVFPRLSAAEFLGNRRTEDEFRIYDPTEMIEQHVAVRYGLELISGYHPGIYGRHLDLYRKIWKEDASDVSMQLMHGPREIACANILDMMNTKYFVAFEPDLGRDYEQVYKTPEHESRRARYVYRRTQCLPRAFIVPRAELPAAGHTVLDDLCAIDLHGTCLVEDKPFEGGDPFAPLPIDRKSPSDVTLDFTSEKGGVAVISQTWHPDWRATDNGLPIEVHRVNYNFVGVYMGPGRHALRIWYSPWDFYLGLAVALVAWTGIAGTGLWSFLRLHAARGIVS